MNRRTHDRKCRDRYREELSLAKLWRSRGYGITSTAYLVGIDARTIKHYLPTGWRDARHDNSGPARDKVKRERIVRRRQAGWTVAEIAHMANISRQRVYQILAEELA